MKFNCKRPEELIKEIENHDIKMIDLRFTDMPGTTHHITVPSKFLNEDIFIDGVGFDGSSVRGFRSIENSDMSMFPDFTTAYLDPFFSEQTIVFYCDIKDPITQKNYSRDPRYIAKKAESYLKSSGMGDTAFFGPEAEFFIFNDVLLSIFPYKVLFFAMFRFIDCSCRNCSGTNFFIFNIFI